MKFATIILLLFAGMLVFALLRRRAAAREAEADALARARSTSRRPRVPTVSSNLKGVTASQTIEPLKPRSDDDYVDDR